MKTKHTPGPWTATKDMDTRGNPCWRIDSSAVSVIAALTYASKEERDSGFADAALMAAAPDLLAALERMCGMNCNRPDQKAYAMAAAAITKAKGRP